MPRHKSLFVVPDKIVEFTDPETKIVHTIERKIMVTNKPCNAEFGDVVWSVADDGRPFLDYTDLVDLTGTETKDYPAGMEVIVLSCDPNAFKIPVRFNHPSIDNVSKVWIKRTDLDEVN